jgi:D-alanyl-D-alanine carboxypeptidase
MYTMKFSKLLVALSFFCIAIVNPGCEDEIVGPPDITEKSVHFDELATNLEEAFDGNCVGFQYTIAKDGIEQVSGAIGHAILPIDGEETFYDITHRKSVHSMTKTFTAAATVHALDQYGINLDASIAPYLPDRWELDPKVEDITFRELLTHKSGLRGSRDTYDQMKEYMESGDFAEKDVSPSVGYANVNFTLLRIIIPMMSPIVNPALNEVLNTDGPEMFDLMAANGYIAYVRNTVLIPAGVDDEVGPYLWDTEEEDATRNYNFADLSLNGYFHTDVTLTTGAGGWLMNTRDYAAFITHMVYGALDGVDKDLMLDEELGLFNTSFQGVNCYTHNGGFTDGLGRGGRSEWIHIPGTGITMVVQINSANNAFSGSDIPNMMMNAYIASYY